MAIRDCARQRMRKGGRYRTEGEAVTTHSSPHRPRRAAGPLRLLDSSAACPASEGCRKRVNCKRRTSSAAVQRRSQRSSPRSRWRRIREARGGVRRTRAGGAQSLQRGERSSAPPRTASCAVVGREPRALCGAHGGRRRGAPGLHRRLGDGREPWAIIRVDQGWSSDGAAGPVRPSRVGARRFGGPRRGRAAHRRGGVPGPRRRALPARLDEPGPRGPRAAAARRGPARCER